MAKKTSILKRIFNARPDTLDFRDKMYEANLYEVPVKIDLEEYKKWKVPILDQGQEGACTGFGLATVTNYLLRRRKIVPDPKPVSPRMLYQMAKRYDEWPGEHYSGSSARGAMKGWHKHGVCGEECWPYDVHDAAESLSEKRIADALKRPLGAYYRVNHKDLVAMHSAMAEVGVLFATATVHQGWNQTDKDGVIPINPAKLGGHAFAIVAYDQRGFWIQNSWGPSWGKEGFALVTYDDWLMHATDVWVARLGAPVSIQKAETTAITHSAAAQKSEAYSFSDLRPHVISLGNNGELNHGGDFGTSPQEVKAIFEQDFPAITKNWKKKRLLLYAHGGLVDEKCAVQRLAEYRSALLQAEVYPVSFIWHSDAWSTITNVLSDALQRRKPEGFLDAAKDFMLDRLDDALEPLARKLMGRLQWNEMKENARLATESSTGGARLTIGYIKKLAEKYKGDFEIHIIGHSAGSIFHAPLIQLLTAEGVIQSGKLSGTVGLGLKVASCTLWAPACTIEIFKQAYLPAILKKDIGRFTLFTLTDEAEQNDHCGRIYNKSLLYLVSNAFEDKQRIPGFRDGVPLLGMEKFINADPDLTKLFKSGAAEHVLAPNSLTSDSRSYSTCNDHGGFDDDKATVAASLGRMLNSKIPQQNFVFNRSASSLKSQRKILSNTNGR
jgi:hypothetical protein